MLEPLLRLGAFVLVALAMTVFAGKRRARGIPPLLLASMLLFRADDASVAPLLLVMMMTISGIAIALLRGWTTKR